MFRGDVRKVLLICCFVFFASLSFAKLADENEAKARERLAAKVLRVGQDLELKEGSFKESLNGGGKETNANDKNSFMSSTTYHSNVWDYCLKWAGARQCDEWLPAYVSIHGSGGDKSPLEGEVFAAWSQTRKKNGQAADSQTEYGIWNIKAEGSPYKVDGTLDREKLSEWRIKEDVRARVAKVGTEAAARVVSKTYENGEAKDGSVMANMESMRMMAGRWTKMFRNRMLANIGEIRAMQPGIEVAQGEDIPDCSNYLNELRTNMDRTKMEDRIDPQNLLAIETRVKRIEDRLKLCQQAKQMNAYAPNVKPQGNEVKALGPKGERIDGALSRANLMAIDYVGINVGDIPIDERIKLQENDAKAGVTVWEKGGRKSKLTMMSNAEQLKGYNRQLASAEVGFEEVAARTSFVKGKKGITSRYAIEKASMNAVKLNDMTPEMMQEVKKGGYPTSVSDSHPGDNLETAPVELVVKKK